MSLTLFDGLKVEVEREELVAAMIKIMKQDLKHVRKGSMWFPRGDDQRKTVERALATLIEWYQEA